MHSEHGISVGIFNLAQINRYSEELEKGLNKLHLSEYTDKIPLFIDYLALFHKWNKAYNLSAIRNPDDMPSKHILDSLSVLPYIYGTNYIDVGTGAGLPGIPLAICLPDTPFTLLDANGKKTRFLFQVVQALKLTNITIANERVENHQSQTPYSGVLCRAYASLPDIVASCRHLLSSDGKIFAMKGLIPRDELSEIEKHYIVESIQELNVPGVEGERNLIVLAARS